MYSDLAPVIRNMKPTPVDPEDIGSIKFAQDLNNAHCIVLANPWGEEHIQRGEMEFYDTGDLQPNPETVRRIAR
eukprot:11207021-Lingulodinium_polyedra.AAC.1